MKLHPLKMFINNRVSAWFWFLLCIVTILANSLQGVILAKIYKQNEKIVVVGDDKSLHVAVAKSFDEADDERKFVAYLAIKSYFDRNPNGFDNPDLLNQIFLVPAKEKFKDTIEKEFKIFSEKQLHQKAEILSYTFTPADDKNNRYLAKVRTLLHIKGSFAGKVIQQSKEVEVNLDMWKNPDIGRNGRLLYAINNIEVKEL